MNILNDKNFYKSNLLIEQHFHGCFGVDFSVCEVDELLDLSKKLLTHGIGGFFPTLVTDSTENINRQIKKIKLARKTQLKYNCSGMAEILGIHIEGIFINPTKKGIHNEKLFLKPCIENYKLIEDDFIKIFTLAPELDTDKELSKYLISKGIKVQAGHCTGGDLSSCTGATHLFNAMSAITHRGASTALSALINNNIYTEIIADGIHLSNDILQLIFNSKPLDKIILISDSLPIAQSNLKELMFAGQKVFYDGKKATGVDGTLAGSTAILNKIIMRLSQQQPDKFETFVKMASDNVCNYHNIKLNGQIYWDNNFNIVAIEKDDFVLYNEN